MTSTGMDIDDSARVLHSHILDIKSKLQYRAKHFDEYIPWEGQKGMQGSAREQMLALREQELAERRVSLFGGETAQMPAKAPSPTPSPGEAAVAPTVNTPPAPLPPLPPVVLVEESSMLATPAAPLPPPPPKPRVTLTTSIATQTDTPSPPPLVEHSTHHAVFPTPCDTATAGVQCEVQPEPPQPEPTPEQPTKPLEPPLKPPEQPAPSRVEQLDKSEVLTSMVVHPLEAAESEADPSAVGVSTQSMSSMQSIDDDDVWVKAEAAALASGEWVKRKDKTSGKSYYLHAKTRKTVWNLKKHLKTTQPATPVAREGNFFATSSAASTPSVVESAPATPVGPTEEQVSDELARVIAAGMWVKKTSQGKTFYLNKKDPRVKNKTVYDLRATLAKALASG